MKNILIILFLFFALCSKSQNIDWFNSYGGNAPIVETIRAYGGIAGDNSAVISFSGDIINLGGAPITEYGAVYSTVNSSPTIANSKRISADLASDGTFSGVIFSLQTNLLYYIRTYAINVYGVGYGTSMTVRTPYPGGGGGGTPPSLSTTIASGITSTSASSGGYSISDNGSPITGKGVRYSTNPTLTTFTSTSDGTGTSSFTSSLIGLNPNTTYYYKAWAVNAVGFGFGATYSFTTSGGSGTPPTVTTSTITNITASTAIGGGNVTSQGSSMVTTRGVCWNTTGNPTISDSNTADGSGTGSFVSNMTGLICGTTYYARAYATNSAGTAYGSEVSFTTTSVHLTNYTFNYYLTSANCGSRNFTASLLDAQDACSDLANPSCTTSPGDGMSGQIFQVESISVGKKIYVYNSSCTVATSITGYYIVGGQIVHVMAGEIVGIYSC